MHANERGRYGDHPARADSLLGVCLRADASRDAFGGKTARAQRLMHGKTSEISHDGKGIFNDLTNPCNPLPFADGGRATLPEVPAG
ncbi:MAG: hypothetical protein H6816_08700 [Phycisphaerales bacterium]|nr:hypothetical protein [Phycisphaerales bacterium]